MGSITIIDVSGKWVINPSSYRFVDPETKVAFEPGIPTRVLCPEGSWLAGQMEAKVIVPTPDPVKTPPKVAAPPAGPG